MGEGGDLHGDAGGAEDEGCPEDCHPAGGGGGQLAQSEHEGDETQAKKSDCQGRSPDEFVGGRLGSRFFPLRGQGRSSLVGEEGVHISDRHRAGMSLLIYLRRRAQRRRGVKGEEAMEIQYNEDSLGREEGLLFLLLGEGGQSIHR